MCISGPTTGRQRGLDAAIELAEHHEGRVTGVYVVSSRNIPGYIRCEIPPEVLKRLDTEERRFTEEAEAQFAERAARTQVPCEWRLMTGDPVDAVITSAHYADITVVGQTDPDDGRSADGLADGVVLGGSGPVLVWPYAGACHATAADYHARVERLPRGDACTRGCAAAPATGAQSDRLRRRQERRQAHTRRRHQHASGAPWAFGRRPATRRPPSAST